MSTISWLRQAGAGRDEGGTTLLLSAVKLAETDRVEAALFRENVPSLALLESVIFGSGQRGSPRREKG